MEGVLRSAAFLGLLGCAPGPVVRVLVAGVPAAAVSLESAVVLDGMPAREAPSVPDLRGAAGGLSDISMGLQLPPGARGELIVGVGVRDEAGCLVATGAEGLRLEGDGSEEIVLRLALKAAGLSPEGCLRGGPVLATVTPARVSTAGEETVTLRGWGFHPGSAVRIGGIPGEGVEWRSPGELRVRAPGRKGQPGPVELAIDDPDGGRERRDDLLAYFAASVRFAAPATYPAGTGKIDRALAGDVDRDGWPDLVVSHFDPDQGTVTVLRNGGDGTFSPQRTATYPAGKQASAIALGDLDNDGWPDLVIGVRAGEPGIPETVQVLRNRGDGTFPVDGGTQQLVGKIPVAVAIADVSGDGWADVITANFAGGPKGDGSVSVLLNQGDGRFPAQATEYPFDGRPVSLAVADLDGDGRLDLITVGRSAPTVCVHLNQRAGTYASPCVRYPAELSPLIAAVADLDGQGGPDLVTLDTTGTQLRILRSLGAGLFPGDGGSPYPLEISGALSLGDVDGDGWPDLVASISKDRLLVARGDGSGAFPTERSGTFPAPSVLQGGGLLPLADLDRDGRLDAVVYQNALVGVLLNRSE